MGGPRILFVTQRVPWPLDSGGNLRTYHLLAALAGRFEVTLAATAPAGDGEKEAQRALERLGARVRLVPDPRPGGVRGRARSLVRAFRAGEPAVIAHNRIPALAALVAESIASGEVDRLHLNHLDAAAHVDLVSAPPAVLDTHNLLFDYYGRRAVHERRSLARALCRRESRLLARYERQTFRAVERLVVCSQPEREKLRLLDPALEATVIPNGVDVAALRPGGPPLAERPADLGFVGDMAYGPNVDGALWFGREVLPLVRARVPAARLVLIGKRPPPALRRLAGEKVEVTGFVPSVAERLQRCRAAVVPLRYGSGTRLKVLEALALGVPLAATTLGAEGIELESGRHALLADDPADLAQACVRLLTDAPLAASLASAGRALAESRYAWPLLGERLCALHAGPS